jgi:esterase/lipase
MGVGIRMGGRTSRLIERIHKMRHKKIYAATTFVILLALLYTWSYFANPARSELRFRTTTYNGHFNLDPEDSFESYALITQHNVKIARQLAHANDSDTVVAENSPVELLPDPARCKPPVNGKYDNGILLVHGLFDSAYPMHMLGKFFQEKCFIVDVILLPGHGTIPGDLLHTTYNDWIAATDFGFQKISARATHIYLGGYSLGGLLVINEALLKPDLVKGLFLFAPALKLKTQLTPLIPLVYWASKIFPSLQWWSIEPDTALVRYESVPVNPVYQINELINIVQKKLTRQTLTMPIFAQESAVDMTVDSDALLKFFRANQNPGSILLWYYENASYPLLHDSRIQLIQSALPAQKILSMSHLSFTLPASDPIYGIHGQYKDCMAYTVNSKNWSDCKAGINSYLGEVTPQDLKTHLIQRITFNPFYDYFTGRMTGFISPANY